MTTRVMDGWDYIGNEWGIVLVHPKKEVYFGLCCFFGIPYKLVWGDFKTKEDLKLARRFMLEARTSTILRFLESLDKSGTRMELVK